MSQHQITRKIDELNDEHKLHQFLKLSKIPSLIRSSCGKTLWVSDSLIDLLEAPDELPRSTFEKWLEFLSDEERETCRKRHRKAIAGIESQHQVTMITESGKKLEVTSIMVPVPGYVDEVAELLLLDSNRPLESFDLVKIKGPRLLNIPETQVRSRMMGISHEFRTPMTGLLGFTQLILDEVSDQPVALEYARMIRKSADSIARLMDSAIEIASLESGCLENYPGYISLSEVVRPVLEEFIREANRREIYMQVKWPQDDHVFIDKIILKTIVKNLVDNAIKFTPTGGVLVVFKVTQSLLRIQVKDSGIGIDPSALPFVFDHYWQESQGFSKRYRGMGIGLSIVKGYVDTLKGTIRIDSTKGEGTIITVEIPMLQHSDDIDIVEFTQSKRILYVEDDPIIQMLSRRILKDYLVDTCFTAEEALERIKSVRYDAFILDIQLGKGMTGRDLASALRAMAVYENVPIAAATALNYDIAISSQDSLFSHYLPKPFNRDQLLDLVYAMVGVRK